MVITLIRKIPGFVNWLFGMIVLVMFGFTTSYYAFVMSQLYTHQSVLIYEYDRGMNLTELSIAVAIILLLVIAVGIHIKNLINLINGSVD